MNKENNAHRAKVGPPAKWDVIGFQQLAILVHLGMRKEHHLLDVGCGCLRAGRFLINYLEPGGYYGIEPDQALLQKGIEREVGQGLVNIKAPVFDPEEDFTLTKFGRSFDFLLAQSIFSHAPQRQVARCLREAREVMIKKSVFAFSFAQSHDGKRYEGDRWAPMARYPAATIESLSRTAGLRFGLLTWPHPNTLTWAYAVREDFPGGTRGQGIFPPGMTGPFAKE